MKQTLITMTILIILFSSCSSNTEKKGITQNAKDLKIEKSEKQIEETIVKDSISSKNVKECGCYNGIGSSENSEPIMTYNFSNGKSVSVCGYKETGKKHISEFNVFDCENGKSYAEYGAVDNCFIIPGNDTLTIQLLQYLPAGNNWTWEFIQIGEQIITSEKDSLLISSLVPQYLPVKIDSELASGFIKSLKKGQGFSEDWENEIGKLEILSLNGNKKAWEILNNYEEFTGFKTDGAMAEDWKNAIAYVEWINGKE